MPEYKDLRGVRLTAERKRFDLKPIFCRILENEELVREFKSVIGANDAARAESVTEKVIAYARTIGPELSEYNGTSLCLMLLTNLTTSR